MKTDKLIRLGAHSSVEGHYASGSKHKFAPHFHEEWTIGAVFSGAKNFGFRRQQTIIEPGALFIIPPGEVHTGDNLGDLGAEYLAWHIAPKVIEDRACMTQKKSEGLFSYCPVFQNHRLFNIFERFKLLMGSVNSDLFCEELIEELIATVLSQEAFSLTAGISESKAVDTAVELIRQSYNSSLTIGQIAEAAGLSSFYFLRLFKKTTGLTPHAYLDNIRVHRAKGLLREGVPIAQAAIDVGYSDQAHLTHRLKRHSAITPGKFSP